jgi:integrase
VIIRAEIPLRAGDESANPIRWVRQKTTSAYTAIIMSPQQAFEILLNVPEPRRTLVLTDAATALRVSEILGLMWADLDFEDQVINVRRAYVWRKFKPPKSKASKASPRRGLRISQLSS